MTMFYLILALIVVGIVALAINGTVTVPRNLRTIVNVVLALIVVGIGLWLINTYVPMAGSIKAILNIVVVLASCVGVLQALGLWPSVVSLTFALPVSFPAVRGRILNTVNAGSGEKAWVKTLPLV